MKRISAILAVLTITVALFGVPAPSAHAKTRTVDVTLTTGTDASFFAHGFYWPSQPETIYRLKAVTAEVYVGQTRIGQGVLAPGETNRHIVLKTDKAGDIKIKVIYDWTNQSCGDNVMEYPYKGPKQTITLRCENSIALKTMAMPLVK